MFSGPQLILQFLQRVSNGYSEENYNFPWFQRGGGGGGGEATFARGVQLFPGGGGGGSIETHITCDFPGGSGPLSPSGY